MATAYLWRDNEVRIVSTSITTSALGIPIGSQLYIAYRTVRFTPDIYEIEEEGTWSIINNEDVRPEFRLALTLMGVL